MGIVLYLFTVGLELDPKTLKGDLKMSLWISAWGLLIPFIGAMMLAAGIYNNPDYSHTNFILMSLFLTTALGISALPVLARIMAERGMLLSRVGGLSMSVAAIDNVAAWCLVAVLLTLVRSPTAVGVLWTALLATGEILTLIFMVRPLLAWLVRRNQDPQLSTETFLYICLILLVFSDVAEYIGFSALIGAFQVGLVIPRHGLLLPQAPRMTKSFCRHCRHRLSPFAAIVVILGAFAELCCPVRQPAACCSRNSLPRGPPARPTDFPGPPASGLRCCAISTHLRQRRRGHLAIPPLPLRSSPSLRPDATAPVPVPVPIPFHRQPLASLAATFAATSTLSPSWLQPLRQPSPAEIGCLSEFTPPCLQRCQWPHTYSRSRSKRFL